MRERLERHSNVDLHCEYNDGIATSKPRVVEVYESDRHSSCREVCFAYFRRVVRSSQRKAKRMSAFVSTTMPVPSTGPQVPVASPRRATRSFRMQANDSPDVCAGCGREGGVAPGCDGNGRVIGGLGAVVGWWPIKAYRPCGDFLKAKKTYRRAGQSLEEIAFGRKGEGDDKSISERLSGQ